MMDFEGSTTSGVVEYGVALLRDGKILSTETALCAPTGEISSWDREIHGIRDSDLSDSELFSGNYRQFVDYRKTGVLAAHNRHAENSFLKSTWAIPPKVPDWRKGVGMAQEWGPWIDTLAIYKGLYPSLESYALVELVKKFMLQDDLDKLAEKHCPSNRRKAHCALYDALASSLLLVRLATEESLSSYLSLVWLLQFSNGSSPQQELF